jgi:hypothetical protein
MAIPAVTCDAKIVISWNEGGGTYDAALSATATESPTGWTWTILSVPEGLEALLSGTWGDFTNGVATTGAGSSSAVDLEGIPTDTADGTIVVQAVATNGEGPSVPATDKANGQQCVVIKSQMLDLPKPGDHQYNWGAAQLRECLDKLETAAGSIWNPTRIGYGVTHNAAFGEFLIGTNDGENTTINLPEITEADHGKTIAVRLNAGTGAFNFTVPSGYLLDGVLDGTAALGSWIDNKVIFVAEYSATNPGWWSISNKAPE